MQSVKETAANVAASAKSGMEKTKAVVGEKVERMTAHNPTEKQIANEKKEERIHHAELNKQEAREQNAAAKQAAHIGGANTYTTTGVTGTKAPAGHGTVASHPIGTATGHNTHAGPGANQGYSTGGVYRG